jgi:hypothetical protein
MNAVADVESVKIKTSIKAPIARTIDAVIWLYVLGFCYGALSNLFFLPGAAAFGKFITMPPYWIFRLMLWVCGVSPTSIHP